MFFVRRNSSSDDSARAATLQVKVSESTAPSCVFEQETYVARGSILLIGQPARCSVLKPTHLSHDLSLDLSDDLSHGLSLHNPLSFFLYLLFSRPLSHALSRSFLCFAWLGFALLCLCSVFALLHFPSLCFALVRLALLGFARFCLALLGLACLAWTTNSARIFKVLQTRKLRNHIDKLRTNSQLLQLDPSPEKKQTSHQSIN